MSLEKTTVHHTYTVGSKVYNAGYKMEMLSWYRKIGIEKLGKTCCLAVIEI